MATGQYLIFRLGAMCCAADICQVSSIVEPMDITGIPNAHPCVQGMINLRGEIVPIVSLKRFFQLAETDARDTRRMIICNTENGPLGFCVDEASQVIHLDSDHIAPVPDLVRGQGDGFVCGIAKAHDGIVILLDLMAVHTAVRDNDPGSREEMRAWLMQLRGD